MVNVMKQSVTIPKTDVNKKATHSSSFAICVFFLFDNPKTQAQAHDPMMEEMEAIMAALSTLTHSQVSDLTHSILSATHHRRRSLSTLLSSPTLFSLTLHYLHSLSLQQKTLLIARHLLSSLHLLTRHFQSDNASSAPPLSTAIRQRELEAVLLLLLFCETHQRNPEAIQAPCPDWRVNLSNLFSETLLTISFSSIGACTATILIPYIEMVTRCWRFIGSMGCDSSGGGKNPGEVAAAVAAVVALPSVEMRISGKECVICKEEIQIGRDVCELPCRHLFHWMCILPWLSKRNTCPCCRLRLPSDDVLEEIQRLWEILVKKGGREPCD